MTAFSDDSNIRAFRLVAASLNTPVAQPAWTDALIDSLTPSLPLVDWDPLAAWSPPTDREASATASTTPRQAQAQTPPLVRDAAGRDRTPAPNVIQPVTPPPRPAQSPAPSPAQPSLDSDAVLPTGDSTPGIVTHPTVPNRPQTGPDVPDRSPAPATTIPAPTIPAPADLPAAWTDIPTQAAAPIATLTEIAHLTGEILSSDPAASNRSGPRSHAVSPSPTRTSPQSNSPTLSPTHPAAQIVPTSPLASLPSQPPSSTAPPPAFNLATLASLYAEDPSPLGSSSHSPPPPSLISPPAPQPPSSPAPLHPHTPNHSSPLPSPDFPSLTALSSDLPPDAPGPSSAAVAETLTDMVSAILQAQAQRHGVDLSWQ
jgi:hypothetical protein